MTNKQQMYIDTVIPAMTERSNPDIPLTDGPSIIDELASALGCKPAMDVFRNAGMSMALLITDVMMALGVSDVGSFMTTLQLMFVVGYDLGRLGALDEMSESDDTD